MSHPLYTTAREASSPAPPPRAPPHTLRRWSDFFPLVPPPLRLHSDLVLYEMVAAFTHRNATSPVGRRRRLESLNLLGANSVLVVRVGFLSNFGNEVFPTCDIPCVLVRVACVRLHLAVGTHPRAPLRHVHVPGPDPVLAHFRVRPAGACSS
jgi:hypothetical protein